MRAVVFAALLVALSVAAPAQAAQARVVAGVWAFLYADMPSEQTYEPEAQATNRPDSPATVTRRGEGRYRVTLPKAEVRGVPMVTAVGGDGVHCQLASFGLVESAQVIDVDCYAGTARQDSRFTLTFFSPPVSGAAPGAYAYVYNRPTPMTYSTGGPVEVSPADGAGVWSVRFPGAEFANDGGNVQVSAVGALPARCAVVGWSPDGNGAVARVRCDDLTGSPTFTPQWTLSYTHERSIVGGDSGFFGYLQANVPDAAEGVPYEPDTKRNRAPNGYIHRVVRSADGEYQVEVRGPLGPRVTLHVSVNGDTDAFCDIVGFRVDPGSQTPAGTVDVACYTAAGVPANAWFSLNYYSP